MKRGLVWTVVILAAAAALDLGVRSGVDVPFEIVLWVESLIFITTALALYGLYSLDPALPGWRRTLQVVLVACFVLAALRSAIWASGRPVTLANAVIFGLGVAGWVFWSFSGLAGEGSTGRASTTNDPPEDT